MADLFLTHSYFLRLDPKEHEAMMPYPPLGTLIAAAELRRRGHPVALFDSMLAGGPADLVPHLERHRPKLVAIYDDDFNYLTKMCLGRMREAAFAMTRTARSMGSTVVIHGSDAVDHLDAYFAHGADYVICGEGEGALPELVAALAEGGDVSGIQNLCFRRGGAVQKNPWRPLVEDLDTLPIPDYSLIHGWKAGRRRGVVSIATSRGCPFNCSFCSVILLFGRKFRANSVDRIMAEIRQNGLQGHHIFFCDDN